MPGTARQVLRHDAGVGLGRRRPIERRAHRPRERSVEDDAGARGREQQHGQGGHGPDGRVRSQQRPGPGLAGPRRAQAERPAPRRPPQHQAGEREERGEQGKDAVHELASGSHEQVRVQFEQEGGQAFVPAPPVDHLAAARVDERLGAIAQPHLVGVEAGAREAHEPDAFGLPPPLDGLQHVGSQGTLPVAGRLGERWVDGPVVGVAQQQQAAAQRDGGHRGGERESHPPVDGAQQVHRRGLSRQKRRS